MSDMLTEGDVILLGDGHRVYADIPEHFAFRNRRGSWCLVHHEVDIGGDFDFLAGEYIVVKTTMDGGGTAHGPGDVYPDGWHVWCERADGMKVDFYQSGSFTAMIPDIRPIGRATRTWARA